MLNSGTLKYYFFFILLFTSYLKLSAQGFIKGIVLEDDQKGNFNPIVGAHVYWLNTSEAAITDSLGLFKIADKRFESQLIVSFTGFYADTIQVRNTEFMSIVLKSKSTLNEVEIEGRQSSSYISSLSSIKTEMITEDELYKAACCNLSESFETNATIDVNTTDPVTGAKQLQMIGLSGIYTQITTENLPGIRGFATTFGLTNLPGSWIESIQISKGVGSVANGSESIAGQVNVEIKKPTGKEQTLVNAYFNQMARSEINLNHVFKKGKKWSANLLLHGNYMKNEFDRNKDGFMDLPDGNQVNVMNRWMYRSGNNVSAQINGSIMRDERHAGTVMGHNKEHDYRYHNNLLRADVSGKWGYVFTGKKYKSFGVLSNYTFYDQKTQLDAIFYRARQQSASLNAIYQSIINNTNHIFRTGISSQFDHCFENYGIFLFERDELVAGAFFEYTGTFGKSTIVAGLRADYNNLFGAFVTPRLHYKLNVNEHLTFRLSGGRGQRTANIISENLSYFVSSRQLILPDGNFQTTGAYNLKPEIAWNSGGGIEAKYFIGEREGSIGIDAYYTFFQRQTVVDLDQSPQQIWFYNLNNGSFAFSSQIDVNQSISRRFDVRLSYKYTDAKTAYQNLNYQQRPFIAMHRGLINIGYHSRKDKWLIDFTANYIGSKRMPDSEANPTEYRFISNSPDFVLINAQITRNIKKWALYIGIENAGDVYQTNQIISPADPHNGFFDASYNWGPVFGRMVYAGVRWKFAKS
jgi:outer membrane receptor for ferrienterochelin and colicins